MTTPHGLEQFDMNQETSEDLLGLFGTNYDYTYDQDFMDAFFGAILQQPAGQPRECAAMACPLQYEAILISFDNGIPTENAIPSAATKHKFRSQMKIPFGALTIMMGDAAFMTKFRMFVYFGQKPAMLAASSGKCNCCGKAAEGFVTQTSLVFPETSTEIISYGGTLHVKPSFPVCLDTECNRKLRAFMDSLDDTAKTTTMMCGYYKCHKVDLKGTKLFACAGCEMRRYCCKEHQKADWKEHKKQCQPVKK